MKLLLTSAGLTNQSLRRALQTLVGKPFTECKAAFIPTAANPIAADKSWLVDNFTECLDCAFAEFDIVDIAAMSQADWLPRLQHADIIFIGGGSIQFLQEQCSAPECIDAFAQLNNRVWVGISAGSEICAPTVLNTQDLFYEETPAVTDAPCLNVVPFYIMPHYNSPHFPQVRDAQLEDFFLHVKKPTYVLDDQSGVLVNGDRVEVISEGKWRKFN